MIHRIFVSGDGLLHPVSDEAKRYYEWMDKMSNNARSTQFHGFAKALWKEIHDEQEEYAEEKLFLTPDAQKAIEKVIARRAYDLAFHSVDYSLEYLDECGIKTSGSMGKRIMPSIPDMLELPKEQE